MADRRHPEERTNVAVADAPAPSATDAYLARAQELREEEGRLGALQARQAGGERLSRHDIQEKTYLTETIAQLQNEVAALVKPMQEEQLALDIEDVVDVHNHFAPLVAQWFDEWVAVLGLPYQATQVFLARLQTYSARMASLPALEHVGETPPESRAIVERLLATLAEPDVWKKLTLVEAVGKVSVGHAAAMKATCPEMHPQQARHLARRVAMRRSR